MNQNNPYLHRMAINMIKILLLWFSVFHSAVVSWSYVGHQGGWYLLQASIGISAMHMQLLHNNKVIMFDRTDFGPSNLSLSGGRCRFDPNDYVLKVDCTAHSILYDIPTNTFCPLMVQTDTWCSSGAVLPNGTLVQTGGYHDGDHVVRIFTPCLTYFCDWTEFPNYLSERRWYASNQILPDGRVIVVGGRLQFNYEFYPNPSHLSAFQFYFLRETRDDFEENNLYPFIHLLPDGNLFIFANTRSILFDYIQNRIIKEFPQIPGESRNYPASGSSVLLPLDENAATIKAEVLLCGGAPRGAYAHAKNERLYVPATSTCGRLTVTDEDPNWVMETMPIPRVMGDMLLLPSGNIIIINGAQSGTAGWECAHMPATAPLIYHPLASPGWRFSVMLPSPKPRMYHSTAILLPDGRVLVGGSNPHHNYNFSNGVDYPTDLSLEAFLPPYLSMEYNLIRPRILSKTLTIGYGQMFLLAFYVEEYLGGSVVSVRIIAPSFTTHSYSMNQRMVVLKMVGVQGDDTTRVYGLSAFGPSKAEIAPPGYYLLFVVHGGIPSYGLWVKIQ